MSFWKRKAAEQPEEPPDQSLLGACDTMLGYAVATGRAVPPAVFVAVEAAHAAAAAAKPPPTAALGHAYDRLVEIVAPATPRTIRFLDKQTKKGRFVRFDAVRVVRGLVVVAGVSLVVFVVSAALIDPTVKTGAAHSFSRELRTEALLLAAAGMGAAFVALYRANGYITTGSFDPDYESTYWVRFLLGIIAGLVLAKLVPIGGGSDVYQAPLLALVGGFSANAVHTVLTRITETVESLVKGTGQEAVAAQASAAKARADEQAARGRLDVAGALVQARDAVASGGDPAAAVTRLNDVIATLLPGGAVPPAPEPPAASAETAAAEAGEGSAETGDVTGEAVDGDPVIETGDETGEDSAEDTADDSADDAAGETGRPEEAQDVDALMPAQPGPEEAMDAAPLAVMTPAKPKRKPKAKAPKR
jgi:hypothetical protein